MQFGKRLPDILIGILIVVLAVGLGSLLLTQRNRTAAVTTPPATTPAVTIPAAPGTTPNTVSPTTTTATVQTPSQPAVSPAQTQPAQTPSTTTPTQPAEQPNATTALSTPPEATSTNLNGPDNGSNTTTPLTPPAKPTPAPKPQDTTVTTPALEPPSTPKVDTSKPPVVTTPPPVIKVPVTKVPAAPVTPPPSATAPTPTTPRTGGAVATSENRVPLRRDYRVSLGVFNSRAELERQTAAVSALGYTVYPINLGDRFVAQVGPFADANTARQARQDIARTYSGATMLAPRGVTVPSTNATDTTSKATPATNTTNLDWQTPSGSAQNSTSQGNTSTSDTTKTTTESASANSDEPAAQRPAPSGPIYLQVGAFDRQESAQSMVSQLKDLGYDPSVQAPEGKKVTVLIGPFRGDALLRTERRLDSNGIDHFRVR